MGSLIVAVILGGIGTVALGLINAWFRAELSAWFNPLVRWLIGKGAARFPKKMRDSVQAEILDMNSARTSPTMKLIDACSFYLRASESARALKEAKSPAQSGARDFRRTMYRAMPPMVFVLIGSAIMGIGDIDIIHQLGPNQLKFYVASQTFAYLGQVVGGVIIWRHFRAVRRVRRLMRLA